jgi:hypothetical protein
MTLQHRGHMENMRDVRNILNRYAKDMPEVTQQLDKAALKGLSEGMTEDLRWRADHVGRNLRYWELVTPDFQRQLTSGQSHHVDPMASKFAILDVDKQALSEFPFYRNSQIVRYGLRCFHRTDGK